MKTALGKSGGRGNIMEYADSRRMVMLLKIKEVLLITGLGKTNLYGQIRSGDFPAPVRLGPRAVAWRSDAVTAWVESRPVAQGLEGKGISANA